MCSCGMVMRMNRKRYIAVLLLRLHSTRVLSYQPRVTVMSCFLYKVIRDLFSIDYLCNNPILRIGLIHK